MMRYYPINLDIQHRKCLVVGGGSVGTRKVSMLRRCGALVTVVSPEVSPELDQQYRMGDIDWIERCYQSSDLNGMFLVIGATNDEDTNRRISSDAETEQCLCNIADRPEICNFILPAIVQQGDLILAVSTSGKSPALAKRLRRELTETYGPEYKTLLRIMGAIRKQLLAEEHAPEAHKPLFEKILDQGLLNLLRQNDTEGIDKLLISVLGSEFTLSQLLSGEG